MIKTEGKSIKGHCSITAENLSRILFVHQQILEKFHSKQLSMFRFALLSCFLIHIYVKIHIWTLKDEAGSIFYMLQ